MSLTNREYDFLFKLVIVGNSGVGKSSLLNRFAKFKTIQIDNKKWDTAGQERFRTITTAYYKGADAILMVYDVTSQTSFDDISSFWSNEAELYGEKESMLMLLGNKSDMIENRIVSFEKAREFANKKDLLFFETSAKTAECVETAFFGISKRLLERKEKQIAQRKKEHREKRRKKEEGGLINAGSLSNRSITEEDNDKSSVIEDPPVPLKKERKESSSEVKRKEQKQEKTGCAC